MTRNQNQIEELFHTVLEKDPDERLSYLKEACAGDQALFREVEALLASFETSNGFLEQPTFDLGLKVMNADSTTKNMVGQEVGSYRILSELGKGGMGEVYLAEDTRLGRKVALKFLSQEFIGDNWAKRQLIREAQAVAMLDHPNICTIYGLEEVGDLNFIVMQYLDGETLSDIIRDHPLSINRVIELGYQIISALNEAHSHGIIHRDIKPRNIMVTNGQVKVLDFGLAKVQKKQEIIGDSTSRLSLPGLLVGTVAYMSPEQLRGDKLDARSDIFSLGTVLYEILCGKNPHSQGTNAEIISAILTRRPTPLRQRATNAPRELERVVQKCLEKDRELRFQSASELLVEWENLRKTLNGRKPNLNFNVPVMIAVILLLVAVSVFVYRSATRPRVVAVLPFANETGNGNLDYLGETVAENITDKLSGLTRLKVKGFSTVYGYRGQVDAQKIARELGLDEVVIGKVTGSGNALSLHISLVNGKDGSQEWVKTYPLELSLISSINEDVSRDVTRSLELWSRGDLNRITTAQKQIKPEAFHEYWSGRYKWRNRDNNQSLKEAIDHFTAAIRIEPAYAEAYAGLADCYALGNVVSYPDLGIGTKEAMLRAERAAKDALDLDQNLAEAYTSRGFVNLKFHWDWNAAERDFRRAIELKPDYSLAYFGYSQVLTITGRLNEAMVQSQKARDLDPFSPVTALNHCREFYYARRFEESNSCFNNLVTEKPDYTNGHYLRAVVFIQRGMYPEAIQILEKLFQSDKRANAAMLGYAFANSGRSDAARAVLAEMEKMTNLPPQEFAFVYLGLNDKEKTFIWLNKAATDRFPPTAYIAVDPMFDAIRSDPRFIEIVKRLNLPNLG